MKERKRSYPYLTARDKYTKWAFYLTIKPNRRIYLQGISKNRLKQERKLTAQREYVKQVSKLENGNLNKPRFAKTFYKKVFGETAVATHI